MSFPSIGIDRSSLSEGTTGKNIPRDQVVYSEPLETVALPNQTSTSVQQQTLSSTAEQPPGEESSDVHDTKRGTPEVSVSINLAVNVFS